MKEYNYKDIEAKWQAKWQATKIYETDINTTKEKMYVLDMFPYPSGEGLHVGHPKGYIATDVYSRMKKMNGYEVLHPMGWDAFGLPAEQYALKNKIHPKIAVEKNIKRFKEQLAIIGCNYDWSKEVNTTDPEFYKWTQWIFKQMFKHNLAFQSNEPINWCPSCMTGLANEDLDGDTCERCGSVVEKKPLRQWVLKITNYADRMLKDLDTLNWPESIKESQRNWIGKSEGAEFDFKLIDAPLSSVKIFTTRADTLYGATFVAISAELASSWIASGWYADASVSTYVAKTLEDQKIKLDYSVVPEKTGVFSGVYAINPATKEKIPVWIANYVLGGVGTGAIMAVPAHDERDFDFAKKFNLPIVSVINPVYVRDDVPEGTPVEDKNKIVAIVENTKGEILCIDWGEKLGGKLFLGGTIEAGELPEVTALRELREETGYSNGKVIAVSDELFMYTYYAFSKEKFYRAKTKFVHIVLADETQEATALEENEKNKFTMRWLSKIDAATKVTEVLHSRAYELFIKKLPYVGTGVLTNSDSFSDQHSATAKPLIVEAFNGKNVSRYKLEDWVFARQRYWGEPFPIVFDENNTPFVVADSELPVKLPEVESYEPTGTGESPLANIKEWVEVYGYIDENNEFVTIDKSDTRAKLFRRETNTMPQWAGSSWYYLRYLDPHNDAIFADKDIEKKWSPIDFYVGGAEHATRHLIYARFYHKFLYDIGVVNYEEPFKRLQNVGLIQAEDGRKMSKRFGNVVNPDDVIGIYGADALRVYEMFMGPFDQSVSWSTQNMGGSARFLERFWKLQNKMDEGVDGQKIVSLLHKTIKKVSEDIESFKFNTAISTMMILLNAIEDEGRLSKATYSLFIQLLAPFAPHITEELWMDIGNSSSVHLSEWPKYDESKMVETEVTFALQISGKMRDTFVAPAGISDDEVLKLAQKTAGYQKYVGENTPKKVIVIQNKLINVVL